MSRIGKKPVVTPAGVTANIEGQTLTVKGPKGTLSMKLLDDLVVVRVVLKTAAGVDGAGEAEAVQLTHELAGGVDLLFQR